MEDSIPKICSKCRVPMIQSETWTYLEAMFIGPIKAYDSYVPVTICPVCSRYGYYGSNFDKWLKWRNSREDDSEIIARSINRLTEL